MLSNLDKGKDAVVLLNYRLFWQLSSHAASQPRTPQHQYLFWKQRKNAALISTVPVPPQGTAARYTLQKILKVDRFTVTELSFSCLKRRKGGKATWRVHHSDADPELGRHLTVEGTSGRQCGF